MAKSLSNAFSEINHPQWLFLHQGIKRDKATHTYTPAAQHLRAKAGSIDELQGEQPAFLSSVNAEASCCRAVHPKHRKSISCKLMRQTP